MNSWDHVRNILDEARDADRACNTYAGDMAAFLVGRLRKVPSHTLTRLKRELGAFDAKKRAWKS